MRNLLKAFFIFCIKFYQVAHKPFFYGVCRFQPTCSHYAIGAIESHGVIKGSWMAFIRILKCHPFHPGGFDPVPVKDSKENERQKQ